MKENPVYIEHNLLENSEMRNFLTEANIQAQKIQKLELEKLDNDTKILINKKLPSHKLVYFISIINTDIAKSNQKFALALFGLREVMISFGWDTYDFGDIVGKFEGYYYSFIGTTEEYEIIQKKHNYINHK